MIGQLLAVDPSVNSVGASLFTNGVLTACARIKSHVDTKLGHGIRCLGMAAQVRMWCVEHGANPSHIVFEWPQIYRAAKSKGDPNDLPALAGVGMAVVALLAGGALQAIVTPTPAEWIGQCPKVCPRCKGGRVAAAVTRVAGKRVARARNCETCHGSKWETPRGRRIRGCLTAAEVLLVPDQHDAIDSVGIGLYGLERLKLTQVFPGAI